MSKNPEVLWAQRSSPSVADKNVIFLTVNLPDISESTLQYKVTSTSLSFKADTINGTNYAFDLELYAEVDTEKSSSHLTSRSFVVVLRKKESKSEYWPRLTKEKIKTPFVKTDFSKWVDEDEQDGNPSLDDDMVGGIPGMSSDMPDLAQLMQQAGGGGGDFQLPSGGDVADSDEDEDGPPPLEEPETSK